MKATIELALGTHEVDNLFERQLTKKRLFIDAIQHRVNKLINRSNQQGMQATAVMEQLEDKITSLSTFFLAETTKFKALLNQKKGFEGKSITYALQFKRTITLYNQSSALLAHFIECYDQLIATLKLLRLAGCFNSDMDYFYALKQYQNRANQLLSSLLLISKRPDRQEELKNVSL